MVAHISELSWQRVNHPREVLSPGQEVQVIVVEIDRERERIGLSLRKLQENPWDTIDQRYSLGQLITGPVTNVTPFGAFVQVEEAVEGLIHASELDVDPQTQPSDVLQPGQQITAKVISLDRQRQRMGLSLRRVTEDQAVNDNNTSSPEEQSSDQNDSAAIAQDQSSDNSSLLPSEESTSTATPSSTKIPSSDSNTTISETVSENDLPDNEYSPLIAAKQVGI